MKITFPQKSKSNLLPWRRVAIGTTVLHHYDGEAGHGSQYVYMKLSDNSAVALENGGFVTCQTMEDPRRTYLPLDVELVIKE